MNCSDYGSDTPIAVLDVAPGGGGTTTIEVAYLSEVDADDHDGVGGVARIAHVIVDGSVTAEWPMLPNAARGLGQALLAAADAAEGLRS